MPDPARWYVLVDGDQTGPFGLEDVRARVVDGELGPDTWVWADGMPEWRRAARVPALVPPPSLGVAGWDDAREAGTPPARGDGPGATTSGDGAG